MKPAVAFVLSVALHAAATLALALWICPWFEQLAPSQARATVDIDVMVVGKRAEGGEKSGAPEKPVPRKAPAPSAADRMTAPAPATAPSTVTATASASVAADGERISIDGGDGQPRVLSILEYMRWVTAHNEPPAYPRLARIRGEQGRALVRVTVPSRGGAPEVLKLEQSSGFDLLDQVAEDAARRWRYPAFIAQGGTQTAITFVIPFKFALD